MLGYSDYALAIARFLSDSHTQPQLCISIQAPWGGGNELDPKVVEKFSKTSGD